MYKNCPLILATVGFIVLVTGILCSWLAFPKLVEYVIGKRIALEEGNEVYEIWKKQPFPLKFKVYFFNVSNPVEVQLGANPILKEIGPYVYDEYWERVNVSIDESADTITYMLKRSFSFNQKASGCRTESDFLTIINGALVSSALQVYLMLPSALATINDAIPYLYKGSTDIFVRATVKDILFDGLLITCHDPEVDFVCAGMKAMLPPTMEYTNDGQDFKFSMFGYMNTTLKGPFVIGRGLKNTIRGNILFYEGNSNLNVWAGPTCNMINGSDSTLFHPMKKPPERMYAFSPDICRSMFVSYDNDTKYYGIPTWRYSNKPESISNSTENECFCPRVKDDDYNDVTKCPKSGLIDITMCVKGPIVVSNPHFYLGDPSLLSYAQGVKPSRELHENYVYFEPVTGNPVAGAKRLQMNVEVKQFEDFTLLNNVTEGIFPMLWIEEGAVVPEKMREMLANGLMQLTILNVLKWLLISSGLLIMGASFILVLYKERLLCFENISLNKVSIMEVKQNNDISLVEPITDIHFNGSALYPGLYPQLEARNVTDKFNYRNNLIPADRPEWKLIN